jgi:DNA-binding MarR family transcriptional regulator
MNESISKLPDDAAYCGPGQAQVQAIRSFLVKLAKARKGRACYLPANLLGEPAWDILLELLLARIERRRTLVKGAVLASGVPMTTALRYIKQLERHGLLIRQPDPRDGRYVLLSISPAGEEALLKWLQDQRWSDLPIEARGTPEPLKQVDLSAAGLRSSSLLPDSPALSGSRAPFRMPLAICGTLGIYYGGGHMAIQFDGGIHGYTHGQARPHSAARTSLK